MRRGPSRGVVVEIKIYFDLEKRRRQAKQSQSRIFFEEKDETFINKEILKT